jgi:excisionase family DNA binding protein
VATYLLVEHVADLLGCSIDTVQRRAAANEIPHRRIGGTRRLLFVPGELDAWINGAELERVNAPNGGRVVRPIEPVAGRPSRSAA